MAKYKTGAVLGKAMMQLVLSGRVMSVGDKIEAVQAFRFEAKRNKWMDKETDAHANQIAEMLSAPVRFREYPTDTR